ncbi:hypothetical protein C2845_PM07G12970 [Panicum miliaceum]|uniref:Uncharacterized protein n=1 Tax=Panicum miliaceum TaxID=4540 RepID=A0A3L6SQA6_PANMI|nr:hypothetical protein C2845_PM07G12970 [Panicum miliaceum]
MSIPGNGHLPASASIPDHSSASDSDAEPEANYSPIAGAASDSESDTDPDAAMLHYRLDEAGNGISALDLASDEDEEAAEEEEEREEGDVTAGRRRRGRSRRTSAVAALRCPRAPRRGSWTRCAGWSSPARRRRGRAASPRTSGSTASAPSAPTAPTDPNRREGRAYLASELMQHRTKFVRTSDLVWVWRTIHLLLLVLLLCCNCDWSANHSR